MSQTSDYLKAIKGVVVINDAKEPRLCCLEDMQETKHFGVGQIFNAVAELNGKTKRSYGSLWPQFKDNSGNISAQWKEMQAVCDSYDSDYDFLVYVCGKLKEEAPVVLSRQEVEARLRRFNMNSAQFVKDNK